MWLAECAAILAGERGVEAVEGEVFEADLDEKVNALADLFENMPAISNCAGVSSRLSKKDCAAVIVRAETSQMLLAGPFCGVMSTARASARRRWPWQSGHSA